MAASNVPINNFWESRFIMLPFQGFPDATLLYQDELQLCAWRVSA
jgi:hypothetical protein